MSRHDQELDAFWHEARRALGLARVPGVTAAEVPALPRPPAWAFGATPEQADELLSLVLAGTKTATASAHADYATDGEDVPTPGELSIVLDGAGHPRALLVTTEVHVVPFSDVDAHHARDEGEGDRSLDHWRAVHERFFREHARDGFSSTMLVVLERFRLLYPAT
jgi:uncharacterized protein YhfF